MKTLITILMLGILTSGCVSSSKLKKVYDRYKDKYDTQESEKDPEPEIITDKPEVMALDWDNFKSDPHKMFLHYTGQNNPADFLRIIAELPIDFQVMSYDRSGASVSIPISDPTGNLTSEGGPGSMAIRRLVLCTFKAGKLIQLEDQAGGFNSHIGISYPLADQIMVVHTRFNGLVSRTKLTNK